MLVYDRGNGRLQDFEANTPREEPSSPPFPGWAGSWGCKNLKEIRARVIDLRGFCWSWDTSIKGSDIYLIRVM